MSDWGEDELDGTQAQPGDVDEPNSPTFGVDVRSLAGRFVDDAVASAVSGEVSKAAHAAVKELMTPEVREAIRRRADEAAAAAIAAQVEEPEEAEPAPQLYYGSTDEFVREYLRKVYRRRIDARRRVWGARFWEYDEALIRLEALWRSWEQLRREPGTGLSVWWRDHADHHMAVLMDPDGPFGAAEDTNSRVTRCPTSSRQRACFPTSERSSNEGQRKHECRRSIGERRGGGAVRDGEQRWSR